jgi:hypothetical protein
LCKEESEKKKGVTSTRKILECKTDKPKVVKRGVECLDTMRYQDIARKKIKDLLPDNNNNNNNMQADTWEEDDRRGYKP